MSEETPRKVRAKRLGAAILRLATVPFRVVSRITSYGWAIILAAAVSTGLSLRLGNIPLLAAAVLGSLVLLGAIFGRLCVRRLAIRRFCPDRAFAGDRISITLTLENRSLLPAGALHIEEGLTDDTVRRGHVFAAGVPGRETEKVRYEMRLRRRGVYRFRPALIRTTFPFGVFATDVLRAAPGRVTVYPRLGEVNRDFYLEMERAMMRMAHMRHSREEEDFRGLREYRAGDNPRWIHWRSSARAGKPMVREFEQPETRRVVVCLDTCTQRLGARRDAMLELAISFVGTLTRDCLRLGYEVDAAAFIPQRMLLRLSREKRNLDALLERLAELKPAPDKNLAGLLDSLDRGILSRAYVVVVALGSIRMGADISRFKTPDNEVRLIDVGSQDFHRIFERTDREERETAEDGIFSEGSEAV